MQQRSFEDILKEKTEQFRLSPKADLWSGIEPHLVQKKKRRVPVFLFYTIAVISIGFIAYNIFQEKHKNQMSGLSGSDSDKKTINTGNTKSDSENPSGLSNNNSEIAKAGSESGNLTVNEKNPRLNKRQDSKTENVPMTNISTESDKNPEIFGDAELLMEFKDTIVEKVDIAGKEGESINLIDSNIVIAKKDSSVNPDPPKPPKRKPLFYAGIELIPAFRYPELSLQKKYQGTEPHDGNYSLRNSNETGKKDFGASVFAGMRYGRHLFEAGFQYHTFSHKISVRNVNEAVLSGIAANRFVNFDINATDSFAVASRSEGGAYVINKYKYLSVPLYYTFMLKQNGKFQAGISGSFIYNRLISYKGLLYQGESGLFVKQGSASDNYVRKNTLMLAWGLDLSYTFRGRTTVFFRPMFGKSLSAAENAPIRTSEGFESYGIGFRRFF